jgi:hypothetical protein
MKNMKTLHVQTEKIKDHNLLMFFMGLNGMDEQKKKKNNITFSNNCVTFLIWFKNSYELSVNHIMCDINKGKITKENRTIFFFKII